MINENPNRSNLPDHDVPVAVTREDMARFFMKWEEDRRAGKTFSLEQQNELSVAAIVQYNVANFFQFLDDDSL